MVQTGLGFKLERGQRQVISLGRAGDELVVIVNLVDIIISRRICRSRIVTCLDKEGCDDWAISCKLGVGDTDRVLKAGISRAWREVSGAHILTTCARLRSLHIFEGFTSPGAAETHVIELILFHGGFKSNRQAWLSVLRLPCISLTILTR